MKEHHARLLEKHALRPDFVCLGGGKEQLSITLNLGREEAAYQFSFVVTRNMTTQDILAAFSDACSKAIKDIKKL